ncbi:MAG: RNA polymerase sigma factor [Cytophagaceae bacterium]|nr:RNA polymerase sigma factor [Cytophagaceae bacterium]
MPSTDPASLPDFRHDPAAFRAFYERYKARVFNTILSYVQSRSEAEELTQDVFVEVHQSAQRFAGNAAVSTWVYRIAVNRALDFLRYQKRQKRFAVLKSLFSSETGELLHDPPDFDHPGVLLERQDAARRLFGAIRHLPEAQQTAFILSYVEELPQAEVAEVMGLSRKAVESLLQRAKANLRKRLENWDPDRRN